jgi:putative flippase GtrA
VTTDERDSATPRAGRHPLRHGLGFLVSGSIAFAVDAVILKTLIAVFAVHPVLARLAAISIAMVAGWLAHRTLTFAVRAPPSVPEFLRYAAVAWTAAAINYGLFVLIVLASVGAMVFSYLGMRFSAFRNPPLGPGIGR